MIKWTTPTLNCTIPSDITGDYVLLTLLCECSIVERKITFDEITDGKFVVVLSQEETAMFDVGDTVQAQVNVMSGGVRLASNILTLKVGKNLHDGVLEDD